MSELFAALGIGAWKPLLTALLLPPVPWLVLVGWGTWRAGRRPGGGRVPVLVGMLGIWLSACAGSGRWIEQALLRPPPALDAAAVEALAAAVRAGGPAGPTIIVLGGGREAHAPEYGLPDLRPYTLARLRYGLWLSGRTGAPLGFTGGTGWAQPDGVPEARIAARVAATEFGRPLAWTESASRDTRGNAVQTVRLLQRLRVTRAVLVTHGWHMPRALRRFDAAAGGSIAFIAAPIGSGRGDSAAFDWLPTSEGTERVRNALREVLARLLGD